MKKTNISALWPAVRRTKPKGKKVAKPAKNRRTRAERSKKARRRPERCQVCGRKPGAKKWDRFGDPDPNPQTPLGSLQRCRTCGLWACPDCWHEVECCFRGEDEHEDDPNWAPPGWKRVGDEWVREDVTQSGHKCNTKGA